MEKTTIRFREDGQGRILYREEGHVLGEMIIAVDPPLLTAYHTEVKPEAEGKGVGKKLLEALVGYARENGLKIVALCPFVHAQFRRHPDTYADVWQQQTV
ncbi:MAG TPA: GNAT family N-acetyltransferase [Chitinophagaceae bacterium]|jgi:hypothetical protein|nr:GNAT family N-acetyltransferase [Chitinophagaceae bacterium]